MHVFILVTALTLFTVSGCQTPAAPQASKAGPAPVSVKAPDNKAPAEPSPLLTTDKKADPSRIPNDAIHAAYRNQPKMASPHGQLPSGHPPVSAKAPFASKATAPAESGVPLPLPLTGPGSIDELTRRLKTNVSDDKKKRIEEAFRLTFTVNRAQRDAAKAATLLAPLVDDDNVGATAERILGYVAVSRGFDFDGAMTHYGRAVEKDR